MDYSEIVRILRDFRDQRGWKKYHNLKDLAISVNLEASEILEIFQWKPEQDDLNQREKDHLKEELSDTMIYLIYMFDKLGIDPGDAIKEKVAFNKHRKWKKIDRDSND